MPPTPNHPHNNNSSNLTIVVFVKDRVVSGVVLLVASKTYAVDYPNMVEVIQCLSWMNLNLSVVKGWFTVDIAMKWIALSKVLMEVASLPIDWMSDYGHWKLWGFC